MYRLRCPECDYKASLRLKLASHLNTAHGRNYTNLELLDALPPVKCATCDFSTKRVRLMLRHDCQQLASSGSGEKVNRLSSCPQCPHTSRLVMGSFTKYDS